MSTHIHPAKRVKGVFFVNGKTTSLSNFRLCRYTDLTDIEVRDFKQYLIDYKL